MPLLALERFVGEAASLKGGFLPDRNVRVASSNGQEASLCWGVTTPAAELAAAESESNVHTAPQHLMPGAICL